jgi:uncharacterized protein (TIGR00369 family)
MNATTQSVARVAVDQAANDIQTANMTGMEQLLRMLGEGKRPGIGNSLDFDLVEIKPGLAVFQGVPGLHAYNPIGIVHGGYAATLLDSACGCAVHASLSATQGFSTLELKVSYHKAITKDTGVVRATGTVVSLGRRVAFSEAKLTDASGKLLASATSTLLVFER